MKKQYIKALALGASLFAAGTLSAQDLSTAYFNEQYLYRHQMNPAYGNEHNYVAIPALGNIHAGVGLNVNAKDVLFVRNGKTVTLLHPEVDARTALGGIPGTLRMGMRVDENILAAGFKAFGGYNTVDIGVKSRTSVRLPKTLVSFLKEGVNNKTYRIGAMGIDADAYMELAFGHSRMITDKLRVGAKVKVLLGAGFMEADLKKADLTLGSDEWVATTNATLRGSLLGARFEEKTNKRTQHRYVSGLNTDDTGFGIHGAGVALDLGADYTLNEEWSFSAAVTDLGFMSWSKVMQASTRGDQTVHTDAYHFNADDDAPNSFEREGDKLRDDLTALYELNNDGEQGSHSRMLGATLNTGVRYTLPYYRKLTFGLLNTTYIYGDYTTTDFRLSANVAPVKQFSASVSLGMGTYGTALGWMLQFSTKGFNMYAGMDHTTFRYTEDHLPMGSTDFTLGMNIPF